MSKLSILFPNAFASFTTSSGNSAGSSYCFIKDNISTPAWFTPPSTSIIFPSAFFPLSGYFSIFTKTLCLFLAFPQLFLEINMSVPKFLSSGTTNPKFLFFWNVPTIVSFSCLIIFIIFPSCFLFPLLISSLILPDFCFFKFSFWLNLKFGFSCFSPIIFISTVSPFSAFMQLSLDINISSS